MKFSEMNTFLTKQAEKIVGANINVTMGSLKSIQVFVLGDVKKPGSFALDSFTTISGALLASGGPADIGSMRRIQLKRNDKIISTLDFYDCLLSGDKSKDKVLQSGDVVFIRREC
jgi:protein involved in polysaccharide export with SLBB domain